MAKTKRDIYKKRTDEGFNINRDVDLSDLRELMLKENMSDDEHNRLAMYINNIATIVLHSAKIAGYPEDIKSEIRASGFLDAMNAIRHFNSSFTALTAPFSYLYRIIFNKATKVLKNYYRQRYVPFSSMDVDFESSIKSSDDEEESFQYVVDDCKAPSHIISLRRHMTKVRLKNVKGQCELFLFA